VVWGTSHILSSSLLSQLVWQAGKERGRREREGGEIERVSPLDKILDAVDNSA